MTATATAMITHTFPSNRVLSVAANLGLFKKLPAAASDSSAAGYKFVGSTYEHVVRWSVHHGYKLNGRIWIIHHIDGDKTNNDTCPTADGHCRDWACGNLAAMSRANHIRDHRSGRMGGHHIKNRAGRKRYFCLNCNTEKSRYGAFCSRCRYTCSA